MRRQQMSINVLLRVGIAGSRILTSAQTRPSRKKNTASPLVEYCNMERWQTSSRSQGEPRVPMHPIGPFGPISESDIVKPPIPHSASILTRYSLFLNDVLVMAMWEFGCDSRSVLAESADIFFESSVMRVGFGVLKGEDQWGEAEKASPSRTADMVLYYYKELVFLTIQQTPSPIIYSLSPWSAIAFDLGKAFCRHRSWFVGVEMQKNVKNCFSK